MIVESRPQSKRYSLSGNVNLTRHLSLLLQGERLLDDTSHEDRVMAGVTVRF